MSRSRIRIARSVMALCVLLAGPLALAGTLPASAEALSVISRRQPLNPDDRAQVEAGQLRFRGALALSSPDRRFGGFSSLLVEPEGRHLIALSDEGHWVRLTLAYRDGWLTDIGEAEIHPLVGVDGRRPRSKAVKDAESLTRLADGSLLVSFERLHRLLRYPSGPGALAATPAPFPSPPGHGALRRNQGIEAIEALPDGRLLALAEGRGEDGRHPGFLWQNGAWSTLSYEAPPRFAPTGAARTPSGDLLVLERAFSLLGGLAARLVRVEARALRPGAVVAGQELGRLAPPLTVDNLEGIAVRRGSAGEDLVYLISDDNFSGFQRTLLMMFAVAD